MKAIILLLLSTTILYISCTNSKKRGLYFTKLLCEYAENPNNIDSKQPRFSWIIASNERGQKQTCFQLLVSSKNKIDINAADQWDSGKTESPQTIHIPYMGKTLNSNKTYYWKVFVWDKNGRHIESPVQTFSTALLDQSDWKAKWIGAGPAQEPRNQAGFFKDVKEQYELADTVRHNGRSVLLRNEIEIPHKIKDAKVFVTGLGFYELCINGKRISDHVLAPVKTHYRKQVLYDTYDVTENLKKGPNAVGIHLGNGWFNPYKKWWKEYRMQWFGAKRALLQLHVEYENGETAIFSSDENWKTSPGPVLYNCIYDGEVYDANQGQPGWCNSDFDDSTWKPVNIVESPGGRLISHTMEPIKVTEEIEPVAVDKRDTNTWIYDMGQNFAGWVKISVSGEKGTKLVLRFAEETHEDGSLNPSSNERAKATAIYTLKGEGTEVYEPRFTFFGFRYVEVSSDDELPKINNLKGCVVRTATDVTGSFECDNEMINNIHRATVWSQKSNMMGYPLDCPQRDERLGWLGDAQVTAVEAMYNMNTPLYWGSWLGGIRENQDKTGDLPIISPRPYIWDEGVEWSSSFFTITWDYYQHYGDVQILAQNYDVMKRYLHFLGSISKDLIVPKGWIGDWGSMVKGWKEGEPESVPTAFYFWNAAIMAQTAKILDKTDDAEYYTELAERIKAAYNDTYFDPETGNYNGGSQMANGFPLLLGIVPKDKQNQVLENLVTDILETHKGHLTCGVLGTKYVVDAVTKYGRPDVAYTVATATGYPSWSDMVEKYTTLCEFWTLKQSKNHVMMGSIDTWFYKYLAGIQSIPEFPGFEQFTIAPYVPKNLGHVKASIETIRGTVWSEWTNSETEFVLKIHVPANTLATVKIPAEKGMEILEGNVNFSKSAGVTMYSRDEDFACLTVASGDYEFTVKKQLS